MEAAGLSIAIAGLFPACVRGYKVFASVERFRTESSGLYWSLRAQELRLISWGDMFGLLPEELNGAAYDSSRPHQGRPPLDQPKPVLEAAHGILTRIKFVLAESQKVSDRYSLQWDSQQGNGGPHTTVRNIPLNSAAGS